MTSGARGPASPEGPPDAGAVAPGPVAAPRTRPDGSPLRLGVMGGTFDPVHHGHLVAASEVAHRYDLDEVVFVPTGEPWQKSARTVSPAEHRYLMTVVATASNPAFTVSRVDVDRPGPTYTIDTLRDLQDRHPGAELFFITGADALEQIFSWKDADRLFDLAQLVGVTRPGHELALGGLPQGRVSLLEIPALAISSTDVRARVALGRPVWYLVPDGIVQYISKHRLYAEPDSASDPEPGSGSVSGSISGPVAVAEAGPAAAPEAEPPAGPTAVPGAGPGAAAAARSRTGPPAGP